MITAPAPKIIWKPLPGSQEAALSCPCHHILYEGTRGPGKTDAQLMKFRRYVGMGYGQFWRGVIFDRGYKNLDDLIAKSQRWFPQFGDGAVFKASRSDYRWVWPTGEELLFRQIKKASDYWLYHGQEFPFIGWNELTKYPTCDLYDAMMSCNRTSFLPSMHGVREDGSLLPEIPLVVFSTTNPYGAGHNWVKARFIDVAKPGEVVRITTNVFDPRLQERRDVVKTQVRLFGSYRENIYLTAEYVAELENITDENKRQAWLHGNWDIVAGGAFDDLWKTDSVILPRSRIPASWRLDRSFDWGSSKPFSIGWWAEATKEPMRIGKKEVHFTPGSLVRFHEFYGTKKIGSNIGLKMSARDVALRILAEEENLRKYGWISGPIHSGPADSQIRAAPHTDEKTIAEKMEEVGVYWVSADKSQGSRINGLQLFRERLEASVRGVGEGVYFFDHCMASRKLLPTLPRDEDNPDDVDSDAEDHIWDDVRYRVLHKPSDFTVEELSVYGSSS